MINVEILKPNVFTKAENKVLILICQCLMRKEIAKATNRHHGTVSKQIESIAQKLDAHSAAEIIVKATAQPDPIVKITILSLLIISALLNGEDLRKSPRRIRSATRYTQTCRVS